MYLPSSPRYGRMPESTLTPAPVKSAVRPGRARNEQRWSTAAALAVAVAVAVAVTETGIDGIEIRTMTMTWGRVKAKYQVPSKVPSKVPRSAKCHVPSDAGRASKLICGWVVGLTRLARHRAVRGGSRFPGSGSGSLSALWAITTDPPPTTTTNDDVRRRETT